MKKLFYPILATFFLLSCVFSNKEKSEKDTGVSVPDVSSPPATAPPSKGENVSVDTMTVVDNPEAKPEPATTPSEPVTGQGNTAGKEMAPPPPPTLDTVAVH